MRALQLWWSCWLAAHRSGAAARLDASFIAGGSSDAGTEDAGAARRPAAGHQPPAAEQSWADLAADYRARLERAAEGIDFATGGASAKDTLGNAMGQLARLSATMANQSDIVDGALGTLPYSTHWRDEAVDIYAVQKALSRQHPSRDIARPCGAAKIAFLFLVYDRVDTEEIWRAFFSGASTSCYSVYVHRAAPGSSRGSFQHLRNSFDVPYTASMWCNVFGLEVALFREALADPDNQQFVLASYDTVPLKSFDYVYEDLVVHSGTRSKVCFVSPASLATCTFRRPAEEGLASVKHHEWLVLRRSHAEAVCAGAMGALEAFSSLRGGGPEALDPEMCTDEGAPAMALLINATAEARAPPGELARGRLDEAGVDPRCTTFVYWDGCLLNTTFDLGFNGSLGHPRKLDEIGDDYLYGLVNSSLLFARKFSRRSSVITGAGSQSLRQRLPLHWSRVRFQPGLRPPVPSLDTRGMGVV